MFQGTIDDILLQGTIDESKRYSIDFHIVDSHFRQKWEGKHIGMMDYKRLYPSPKISFLEGFKDKYLLLHGHIWTQKKANIKNICKPTSIIRYQIQIEK